MNDPLLVFAQQQHKEVPAPLPSAGEVVDKAREALLELRTIEQRYGNLSDNPFYGSRIVNLDMRVEKDLDAHLERSLHLSNRFIRIIREVSAQLELPVRKKPEFLVATAQALCVIDHLYSDDGKSLKAIDPFDPLWDDRSYLESAVAKHVTLGEFIQKAGTRLHFAEIEELDLDGAEEKIREHYRQGFISNLFDFDFRTLKRALTRVSEPPKLENELIEHVGFLRKLQDLIDECTGTGHRFSAALNSLSDGQTQVLGNTLLWYQWAQFAYAMHDFKRASLDHPDQDRLENLLRSPTPVYALSKSLKSLNKTLQEIDTTFQSASKLLDRPLGAADLDSAQQLAILSLWRTERRQLGALVAHNRAKKSVEDIGPMH